MHSRVESASFFGPIGMCKQCCRWWGGAATRVRSNVKGTVELQLPKRAACVTLFCGIADG
eukprot:6305610-Alexandrium_andersonii.AAC.1